MVVMSAAAGAAFAVLVVMIVLVVVIMIVIVVMLVVIVMLHLLHGGGKGVDTLHNVNYLLASSSDQGVVMTVALGLSWLSIAVAVTTLPSAAESVRLRTITSAL